MMDQRLKLSDTYYLTYDRSRIIISEERAPEAGDRPVLTLPGDRFLRASYSTYTLPHGNNHYHNLRQTEHHTLAVPKITSIELTTEGISIIGTLSSDRLGPGNSGSPASVSFTCTISADAHGLAISAQVSDPGFNRLHLVFATPFEERFYGFGEQFTHVDLTGMRFPLITGEQGLGRGAEPCSSIVESRSGSAGDAFTTYSPIAVCITSAHRAFFVENPSIMVMDIKATDPDLVDMEIWDTRIDLRVWQGTSLIDAIARHTAFTGRYTPLPRWAHGTVLGLRGGRAHVERMLEQCERFNVPINSIWIEDWVGRRGHNYGPPLWWRWEPNEEVYPDFVNWVKGLADKGIKVLTYFNPFIADDKDFSQCREGLEHGYFVLDPKGAPYHKKTGMGYGYYMIDLSNPAAYQWMKEIMLTSIREYGVMGWMADYGEYLTFDAIVSGGEAAGGISGEHYHQQYALDWIRLNREVAEESGKMGDLLIFNRCGSGTVNRHAICYWEGDQNVTWDEHDGLGSSIVGLLSGGLSGIALNHSDIGGHTTLANPLITMTRSKELLWRWLELAVFQPVFRTHIGTLEAPNHQFYSCDETFGFFGLMGRLHDCFTDYFLFLEQESARTGLPLIRHTMLHDEEAIGSDLRYQFMLGEDVTVFPVWVEGADAVEGFLPAGSWIHAWDGTTHEGSRRWRFPAGLGRPVFLVRKHSIQGRDLLERLEAFRIKDQDWYRKLSAMTPASLQADRRGGSRR